MVKLEEPVVTPTKLKFYRRFYAWHFYYKEKYETDDLYHEINNKHSMIKLAFKNFLNDIEIKVNIPLKLSKDNKTPYTFVIKDV